MGAQLIEDLIGGSCCRCRLRTMDPIHNNVPNCDNLTYVGLQSNAYLTTTPRLIDNPEPIDRFSARPAITGWVCASCHSAFCTASLPLGSFSTEGHSWSMLVTTTHWAQMDPNGSGPRLIHPSSHGSSMSTETRMIIPATCDARMFCMDHSSFPDDEDETAAATPGSRARSSPEILPQGPPPS